MGTSKASQKKRLPDVQRAVPYAWPGKQSKPVKATPTPSKPQEKKQASPVPSSSEQAEAPADTAALRRPGGLLWVSERGVLEVYAGNRLLHAASKGQRVKDLPLEPLHWLFFVILWGNHRGQPAARGREDRSSCRTRADELRAAKTAAQTTVTATVTALPTAETTETTEAAEAAKRETAAARTPKSPAASDKLGDLVVAVLSSSSSSPSSSAAKSATLPHFIKKITNWKSHSGSDSASDSDSSDKGEGKRKSGNSDMDLG
ncbi:hypothetical protein BCR41DRAFT_401587 [Lobosporangium transversale]|uniref:Uncharacterized protein n=1 Tax=Lobosporangium transversale TaxID=64571 RepID=A0A1Y2G7A3_9FUNG|nr:hypothetical protein BCR41DRAFT_401587 [Lobosporangium transversale]ORY99744.1 hypothetical protein BCR41DRAFT_401587 [Lobosporangium transversale]|eukprot:XP_021875978.1 hypothetical protein BCR41DRAFT_401587 [Lobosporangium transversale]